MNGEVLLKGLGEGRAGGKGAVILMCPPDYYAIRYEINPWMNVNRGADHALARRQWSALRGKIEELGARVEEVLPRADLPDLVFTANAGLVYRDMFVGSNFRHSVRQGESAVFDSWFERHGYRVIRPPEGVYFEGAGDALFCGETLLYGYQFRSAPRGHAWLSEIIGVEVLPVQLVNPRYYHLDTCFCPLDQRTAIYYPGAFDAYGLKVLSSRVERLIEVDEEEAAEFSCNAVVIGGDVILNDVSPRLADRLGENGFRVHRLGLGEFIKSGGSAKCLTLRLDGEDAAAWVSR